jgi:hypothetical protein
VRYFTLGAPKGWRGALSTRPPPSPGFDFAIAYDWLWLRESGTYVKFTQAGADLFA